MKATHFITTKLIAAMALSTAMAPMSFGTTPQATAPSKVAANELAGQLHRAAKNGRSDNVTKLLHAEYQCC